MKLVRLVDAAESKTPLGDFLGALMRPFKPEPFVMQIGRLEHNLGLYKAEGGGDFSEHRFNEVLRHFQELERIEIEFGLTVSANGTREYIDTLLVDRLRAAKHLDESVRIARQNLQNEMRNLAYFEIPAAQRQYWNDPKPFGPTVSAKFPETDYDLEQAAKCLALDRYTACVFHLMRALDHVLNIFAGHLKCTFDPLKNWKPILRAIKDKIEPMPETNPAEKIKKEDYWRVYGHLQAVMNAWRHPTMHPRKDYDIESAEDVFCATRGFMRDLAKVI